MAAESDAQTNRELVVMVPRGTDHDLSSVAFTVACGGIASGMKVHAFLVSSAVDADDSVAFNREARAFLSRALAA